MDILDIPSVLPFSESLFNSQKKTSSINGVRYIAAMWGAAEVDDVKPRNSNLAARDGFRAQMPNRNKY